MSYLAMTRVQISDVVTCGSGCFSVSRPGALNVTSSVWLVSHIGVYTASAACCGAP